MTKGLLQSSGAAQHILVGNLKHKDLAGHVVPSQAYAGSSSEGEGNDEDADAEDEPDPGGSLSTCLFQRMHSKQSVQGEAENLNHRDLAGHEVLFQAYVESFSEEEGDDEDADGKDELGTGGSF